mmetsp:Transcript_24126/g.50430  ORF Transcript_24126/g.50430 Transcript_24126/m.50430 type:complete len:150 (-) Transcript_24126:162-611(-)
MACQAGLSRPQLTADSTVKAHNVKHYEPIERGTQNKLTQCPWARNVSTQWDTLGLPAQWVRNVRRPLRPNHLKTFSIISCSSTFKQRCVNRMDKTLSSVSNAISQAIKSALFALGTSTQIKLNRRTVIPVFRHKNSSAELFQIPATPFS